MTRLKMLQDVHSRLTIKYYRTGKITRILDQKSLLVAKVNFKTVISYYHPQKSYLTNYVHRFQYSTSEF